MTWVLVIIVLSVAWAAVDFSSTRFSQESKTRATATNQVDATVGTPDPSTETYRAPGLRILGTGDTAASGGAPTGFVVGDWIAAGNPAKIAGFVPGRDRLTIGYTPGQSMAPAVELARIHTGLAVWLNGTEIARVSSDQDLTADDIVLFDRDALYAA